MHVRRCIAQIYQFTIHVTAYISVYTLVLMSLDRYLAVVHPIQSLTLRTQRHAMIAVVTATIAICILNTPTLPDYGLLQHRYGGEDRVACINMRLLTQDTHYGFVGPYFRTPHTPPLQLSTRLSVVDLFSYLPVIFMSSQFTYLARLLLLLSSDTFHCTNNGI